MKLVRYEDKEGAKLGVVKDDGVIELTKRIASLSDSMINLIRQWPDLRATVQGLVAAAHA